jgi:peptidoglycan/LPS O-acetylase OafA/YrhL
VVLSHVLYENQSIFVRRTGAWGVNLFFVLSGFLITTLLMRERLKYGQISFRLFYLRRTLRIIPAAFLFLVVMALLNPIYGLGISALGFLKAGFYLQNLPLPVPGNQWYLAHFWSLSVEEQYYLIAPALLSLGFLALRRFAIAVIVAAHLVIYAIYHGYGESVALTYVDAIIKPIVPLTLGSLAAELTMHGVLRVRPLGSLASLGVLILSYLVFCGIPPFIPKLFVGTVSSLLLAWLVLSSIHRTDSVFFAFLNARVMTQLGIWSYSIYIWQQAFSHNEFLVTTASEPLTKVINLALLGIFAVLSYRYFEQYFLRLKDRFTRG